MILPIVTYGNEILKEPAKPVESVTPEVRELVETMLKTMYDARGLGLAAEQVGRTESIAVIDVPVDMEDEDCLELNSPIPMPLIMINPEILQDEGQIRRPEGCLSFPNLYIEITRAKSVTFQCTDLDGERHEYTAHGLLARAVQHEIDHLKGVLLVDRMSPAQRVANAGKLRRIKSRSA